MDYRLSDNMAARCVMSAVALGASKPYKKLAQTFFVGSSGAMRGVKGSNIYGNGGPFIYNHTFAML